MSAPAMAAECVRREGRAIEIELRACCDWPSFYFSELYGLWLLLEAAQGNQRSKSPGLLEKALPDELVFHRLSHSKDEAARHAVWAPYIHAVSYAETRNWEPRICRRAPSGRFERATRPDDAGYHDAWGDLVTLHESIARDIVQDATEPYRRRLGLPEDADSDEIEAAIERAGSKIWSEYVDLQIEVGAKRYLRATIRIELTDKKWLPSMKPGERWDVYVFDGDALLL